MFGRTIDRLDTQDVIDRDELFERLCRVISLTEQRGYRQVEILLANRHVAVGPGARAHLRDHPPATSRATGRLTTPGSGRMPSASPGGGSARSTASSIPELLFLKLPVLFLNLFVRRRTEWADAHEDELALHPHLAAVSA